MINPLYVFIGIIALVLGTVAGVVYCAASGNKDQIPTIIGITSPIVLSLLGALGLGTHQQNVAKQNKIEEKADLGIEQNSEILAKGDAIVAKVDTVKQLVNGTGGQVKK